MHDPLPHHIDPPVRLHGLALTFDSADPPVLGHFWSGVTGYRSAVNEPDYILLEGEGLGVSQLVFVEVPDWKANRNRLRIELVTDDLDTELDRLLDLGATVFDHIDRDTGRRVQLRDPEGNEFSLLEPSPKAA